MKDYNCIYRKVKKQPIGRNGKRGKFGMIYLPKKWIDKEVSVYLT